MRLKGRRAFPSFFCLFPFALVENALYFHLRGSIEIPALHNLRRMK